MTPFTRVEGRAYALPLSNIDTDLIIPKQFLKRIERTGFGEYLFWDWAREENGAPISGFELNRPEAQGASVLVTRRNFGCGSSREHAPWALEDWGFRVLIAPSFADIFYNNSLKNGLLPVALPEATVNMLLDLVEEEPETRIVVNLEEQKVVLPDGQALGFDIDPFRKMCLLQGVDDLGYIMSKEDAVAAHEARRPY